MHSMTFRIPWIPAVLLAASLAVADDRTMSFNSEVPVLPAPGAVTIDGQTNDWDLSGGVWSYNDPTLVDRYSVWTHMMWDSNGVYLLARYHDLSPLQNATAGKDFSQSWRADCYQARVIFDDGKPDEHQMHMNLFYSSADKRPYLLVKHGGFKSAPPYDATGKDRPDQLETWGMDMAEHGGRIAFAPWADGPSTGSGQAKGYNMEVFWPWSYCRTSGAPLKPGEAFTFGIEAMWGNADGTQMSHRLADGIKDETVNRIFMFRARTGWGRAVLRDHGRLDLTAEQIALQQARLKRFQDFDTYGAIPIAYELPEARDVSIVIDNAAGRRVRCLFGQYPRNAGKVTDLWDGLDDDGNPVAPGTYTAAIVHHRPIDLKFFNSVYSSATPPWRTEAGAKLWGSNHGHPTSVATRGPLTVLTFTGTEGGSGIQLINDDGIIQWNDFNEFLDATLDDQYAYGLSRSSWQQKTLLFRFRLKDGAIVPFDDAQRTPSPALLPDSQIATESSIALAFGKLWALIPGRGLLRIDPSTGAVEATLPTGDLAAVTERGDTLYGLTTSGGVVTLDRDAKPTLLFAAQGLRRPARLGVSDTGTRFAISDTGNNQVVIVDRAGQRLHAIGTAYVADDRPAGPFVTTDLIHPLGADFDHLGRLWTTEGMTTCKRVSCWSPDYALVDQYWGQADYGAMSGFPLTFDATRFLAHGIEFQLDPRPDPWHRKTAEQPLVYHPDLAHRRGFIYRVGNHEYAGCMPMQKADELCVFKRDEAGVFRMAVRIDLASRRQVKGTWQAKPGQAWTDRNENGKEDEGEVTRGLELGSAYWSNGWIGPDLSILSPDGWVVPAPAFSPTGVPLYDFAACHQATNWITVPKGQSLTGTPVMDKAGNVSDGIRYHTVDGREGAWPNRYGRHDAPAARRGVLIAPFRCNGIVEGVPGVSSVTALGGDRGEWFLMTMDGIYLSSICQDSKANVTLDETFIGQESFGGFFWRDGASKQVYVQLGGPSYRLMALNNLDTCARETRTLAVTEAQLAASARILAQRRQQNVRESDSLRVARVKALPAEPAPVMLADSTPLIDGGVDVRVAEEGNPAQWFRASLAQDGRSLAVMFQVADPSPWKNAAGQYTHAFIGGDCVDVQLDVPGRGPIRLLAAPVGGKPTAIYWQKQAAVPENPITYAVGNNTANAQSFAVNKRLDKAVVKAATGFNAYTVLVTVPLAELGLDKAVGEKITGQVGVIYSDPSGANRASRLYWHNKKTGLVSDVPSEARLDPQYWGPIDVDK